MPYKTESQVVRKWTAEIDRLRARAARLARRMPLDDAGAIELLNACLVLSESLLRDLSGAILGAEALERQVTFLDRWWLDVFDEMPLACLEVDEAGEIVRANRAAAVLLNTSANHLQRRHLCPFVQDRDRFATFLQDVSFEPSIAHVASFTIRPRERAAIEVKATAMNRQSGDRTTSLWFLELDGTATRPTVKSIPRSVARARGNASDDTAAAIDEQH